MEDIKYYPLVDMDTDGKAKVPMFMSLNEKDMERHRLWLEEIIPGSFRLCSSAARPGSEFEDMEIHCPSCGRPLKALSEQRDGNVHALYICTNCR